MVIFTPIEVFVDAAYRYKIWRLIDEMFYCCHVLAWNIDDMNELVKLEVPSLVNERLFEISGVKRSE